MTCLSSSNRNMSSHIILGMEFTVGGSTAIHLESGFIKYKNQFEMHLNAWRENLIARVNLIAKDYYVEML